MKPVTFISGVQVSEWMVEDPSKPMEFLVQYGDRWYDAYDKNVPREVGHRPLMKRVIPITTFFNRQGGNWHPEKVQEDYISETYIAVDTENLDKLTLYFNHEKKIWTDKLDNEKAKSSMLLDVTRCERDMALSRLQEIGEYNFWQRLKILFGFEKIQKGSYELCR